LKKNRGLFSFSGIQFAIKGKLKKHLKPKYSARSSMFLNREKIKIDNISPKKKIVKKIKNIL